MQQTIEVDIEEHPMNRLELQPRIVHVDQFDQRIAGRMVHDRFPVIGLVFDLFPDRLGGGEGMVAVPHGVKEHRPVFDLIALGEATRIG